MATNQLWDCSKMTSQARERFCDDIKQAFILGGGGWKIYQNVIYEGSQTFNEYIQRESNLVESIFYENCVFSKNCIFAKINRRLLTQLASAHLKKYLLLFFRQ